MDAPNERSSHSQSTPTMGGIAFYVSLMFTLFFIREYDVDYVGVNIASAVSVMFFLGLKDDLTGVNPSTKIIGQFLATFVLLFEAKLRIYSLDGFLWLDEIPFWFSVIFSCFITMSIVNSFNLIDGINGSAAMVGIVIFGCFSYVFYQSGDEYYFLFSLLCVGFLLAFLRYNLSSRKKIFMGDAGSMVVGFIIGILALKFLSLSSLSLEKAHINPSNKMWVLLAIVFVPFFDTTRVFIARTIRHGKPFKADRNHIHHVMIDYMGLSHARASLLLATINLIIFLVVMLLSTISESFYLFAYIMLIYTALVLMLFYFNKSYITRKSKQKIRKILNSSGLNKNHNKIKQ
ncbi:undecaprenyl-phosphate alpha-N-acetylglucosaminyl 1-phosphate transferase [Capnocytophaga felis]|uniref:Undecaprenyl-phosphate alpha-N-acetylglucosaminyl 1-phosphate transferase n=2 Tax=Capnocytophaga felis TaxID=2267611 RepID=A0A5M4B7N6_9FLAO|nr:undecaprenyl-phosphate alpha-N-acetylglucosaminyl 1-phosphate transferase [Capnocytophaga felis]GET47299.1 undecaprenyl-phosphate alpha-N-acetylglucosaminyl 1-phosphate transferase [Capnocytophaga felis]